MSERRLSLTGRVYCFRMKETLIHTEVIGAAGFYRISEEQWDAMVPIEEAMAPRGGMIFKRLLLDGRVETATGERFTVEEWQQLLTA